MKEVKFADMQDQNQQSALKSIKTPNTPQVKTKDIAIELEDINDR